jgi:hypothetical protein
MAKTFSIMCEHCERDFEFTEDEAKGLSDHITTARSDAFDDGVDEGKERASYDYVDVRDQLVDGKRHFWELSAALRRGDIREAELQLDMIAEKIGGQAVEDVQQGRFSYRARAA